jgi:predicted enzyme related to lactoylglutathione lyase
MAKGPRASRITGIGGIFKAKDPDALARWYDRHLGIGAENRMVLFSWRSGKDGKAHGQTVWSIFPEDTEHFGDKGPSFTINFRVKDLDTVLKSLRREGVDVEREVQDKDNGRFGWITDPEGNRIELWHPPAGSRPPEASFEME